MKTLALVGKGLAGGLLGRERGRGRGWKVQGMMTTEAFSVRAKEKKRGTVYHLGQVPYETAWTWQHELIKERFRDGSLPDVVLSLEHPSVYTIGRGGSYDHVKFDADSKEHTLIKVDRGGEVTYHGPGQLVMYTILNLRHHKMDLRWYLRQMEEVVIQTLNAFDITGERIDGLTGVWVHDRKVAAVGTHASKWITMHGFALNVTTDLSGFDNIIPCGISDRKVGGMNEFIPDIKVNDVEKAALRSISNVFDLDLESKTKKDFLLTRCTIN